MGWISFFAMLLPGLAYAGMENCRIVEYPDHIEAVCIDAPPSRQANPEPQDQVSVASQQDSAPTEISSPRFHRLRQVRQLGSRRKADAVQQEMSKLKSGGSKDVQD